MKFTVAPSGACTIKKIQRGPLGFGQKTAKQPVEVGNMRLIPATGRRTMPMPRFRPTGPQCKTRFKPMAQSNFKLMYGGKRQVK